MSTISTHNGCQVAREHNKRNPKVVSKEDHINPDGVFEIWKDENPRVAYLRLYGDALNKYNARQSREDRKITDYYKKIQEDKRKHTVYELIAGVYDRSIPFETKREILKEYADEWEKRNPNLELVGVYFHADEQGEEHIHLDYIPVARGCKRGLETQNSLAKALEQQGIVAGKTMKETAQILWEQRENEALEKICNSRGIEIEHPQKGNKTVHHMETELFKLQKEKENLEAENERLRSVIEHNRMVGNHELKEAKEIRADLEEVKKEIQETASVLTEAKKQSELGVLDRFRVFVKNQDIPQPLKDFTLQLVKTFEDFDARARVRVREWKPKNKPMLSRDKEDIEH